MPQQRPALRPYPRTPFHEAARNDQRRANVRSVTAPIRVAYSQPSSGNRTANPFSPLQDLGDDDAVDGTLPSAAAPATHQAHGQVRPIRIHGPRAPDNPAEVQQNNRRHPHPNTTQQPRPNRRRSDLADIANSAYPTDSAPSGLTLIASLSKQLSPPTPQQLPHKQSPASCTSLSTLTVGLPLEWKLFFRQP
jgi:hypothetical protein